MKKDNIKFDICAGLFLFICLIAFSFILVRFAELSKADYKKQIQDREPIKIEKTIYICEQVAL